MPLDIGIQPFGNNTARLNRLSSDGRPKYRQIGADIAWDLIPALTDQQVADWNGVTPDGVRVHAGEKIILIGTTMSPITTKEVQTITLTGATGGNFDAVFKKLSSYGEQEEYELDAIPYNISAAAFQALLEDIYEVGKIAVALAGSTYTLTYSTAGNIETPTLTSHLTGTSPTVVAATQTQGTELYGSYAPFDSSQSNGQQVLSRRDSGITDYTIRYSRPWDWDSTVNPEVSHIGLIYGGWIYRERLQAGGTNQPTLDQLLTAFPELNFTPLD
jgi:hypothetical protein